MSDGVVHPVRFAIRVFHLWKWLAESCPPVELFRKSILIVK
ncbi:hypothetical protein C7S13_7932 [Burkholderia cepacia]|nr:hypothetical protein [Burkholderia cepacia]MDW9245703.1 hypothetical protein [Burkholderia cepacia]